MFLHAFLPSSTDTVKYPQDYFKSPLEIPLLLAGNYAEPRTGHFHAGLDLQTQQQEGLPVHVSADGYVSRINVSSVGYGNALYVTHPNGYVSVYGHLKEFTPALMARLRKDQYAKKQFAVDVQLKPDEFPVKQGDVIAYSGSTGSSGGPHLHFEIRDAAENPVNPMLFGFKIRDATAPLVKGLKFYPMDSLKYNCDGYRCGLSGRNGQFEVQGGLVKLNCTKVGISVNTYDLMDRVENKLGIYTLKLFENDKLIYEFRADRMSFKEGRYLLSQVDYPIFQKEDEQTYHKCFVEPGNKCPVYSNLVKRGVIDMADSAIHVLRIEVSDFNGNVSTVHCQVQYSSQSNLMKAKERVFVQRFDQGRPNGFSDNEIKLSLPADCLFDTLYFNHSSSLSTNGEVYSKEHLLGDVSACFFDWFHLSIKAERLNPRLRDKAVIVFRDEKGNEFSRGGTFEGGFVSTQAREFGLCYIKVDTIPPHITPVNISAGKNMRKSKGILFKITDNLSGIGSYNLYLDDNWVECDYDAKSATLIYKPGEEIKPGEHRLKLLVEDERHNSASYQVKFAM